VKELQEMLEESLKFSLLYMLIAALIGCSGFKYVIEPLPEQSPTAQTPQLIAVGAFPFERAYRTNISPNFYGEYEIYWTGGITVSFRAPWPAAIEVTVNGEIIQESKSNIVSNDGLGSYLIAHTKVSQGSVIADWEVDIIPNQFLIKMRNFFTVNIYIRNLSINPKETSKEKVSYPLVIKIKQPCPTFHMMFSPLGYTSPFGFTHRYNPMTRSIEIWKNTTLVYSHVRVGNGAWEVFYYQHIPYEAIILEHRAAHHEIYLIALGETRNSGIQIGFLSCK
jgi:hypothetical protein